jgi:hypothetical protein
MKRKPHAGGVGLSNGFNKAAITTGKTIHCPNTAKKQVTTRPQRRKRFWQTLNAVIEYQHTVVTRNDPTSPRVRPSLPTLSLQIEGKP